MARLAIDFDGVLHDHKKPIQGRRMGGPIEGAQAALKRLQREGNYIIIHSVRGDSPRHIEDWMRFYDIPFDEVTRQKPDDVAFFIDDHALRFEGNWEKTLQDIELLDKVYKLAKVRHLI